MSRPAPGPRQRGSSHHTTVNVRGAAPLQAVIAGLTGASLLSVSACAQETTCDAAFRLSTVEVSLSQDWPERADFTVRVDCADPENCLGDLEPRGPVTLVEVGDPRALDTIDVTIVDDRSGSVVLAETFDLSWTHHPAVQECDTPWSQDRVVVPVPDDLG